MIMVWKTIESDGNQWRILSPAAQLRQASHLTGSLVISCLSKPMMGVSCCAQQTVMGHVIVEAPLTIST